MDKQPAPQPSDVPALNEQLKTETLHVTLGTDQEGQPPLPLGTVTEFVALDPHVLARVRFPEGRTVKVPVSLLHKSGGLLFVMDEANDLPDETFADASDINESTPNEYEGAPKDQAAESGEQTHE